MIQSQATILLTIDDVELVDDADDRRDAAPTLRFARTRLFLLSVLLGLTIGVAFSVAQPVRSKRMSAEIRGTAYDTTSSVVAAVSHLVHPR
jgi:hypothetical protein